MVFHSVKLAALPRTGENPESATLRAFAILEHIAAAEEPPTLEALTRAIGLPKPTVFRILRLLVRGGLVQREVHEKRYLVGERVAALALDVHMQSPRRLERRAILARLVETIGETCNFTMLDGKDVLYVDRVETSANVRLHMQTGSRVPPHCTASGKLLLSELPAARLRRLLGPGPFPRYTPRTVVSPSALERELSRIRASGVGIDIGEYLADSVCLAVPVRDASGRMCAAIAVHGPAPRMSLKRGHGFVPAMRDAAAAMTATFAPTGQTPTHIRRRADVSRKDKAA